MITKLATLTGTEHTVINPIVNNIISFVKSKIIKDEDALINKEYMFNDESVSYPDNTFDNPTGGPTLDINIEVTETEDFNLTTSTYKPINKIIFLDNDNTLNIRPVYVNSDIEFTFKYRGQIKSKLLEVKNSLNLMYTSSNYTFIHDVPYSFMLPANILELLDNVNRLKNDVTVTSTLDYIESIALFKYDLALTRDKKHKVPLFNGKQVNIIGNLTTVPSDIKVEKGDGPEYEVSFNYIISIQKPIGLAIQYPILINNKPLDSKWLPRNTVAKVVKTANGALDVAEIIKLTLNEASNNYDYMYRIPDYDNFVPYLTENMKDKLRIVSILIEVNPVKPNNIFNLNDLLAIGLPSFIVDYFKDVKENLFLYGSSMFLVELFQKDNIVNRGLVVDSLFNVTTTTPLVMNESYHIVISLMTNFNFINYTDTLSRDRDIAICDLLNITYEERKVGTYTTHKSFS